MLAARLSPYDASGPYRICMITPGDYTAERVPVTLRTQYW